MDSSICGLASNSYQYAKRFVHRCRVGKYIRYIRRKRNNLSSCNGSPSVFTTYALTEIVFFEHFIIFIHRRYLLHTAPFRAELRVAH